MIDQVVETDPIVKLDITVARSFLSRLIGLLGRRGLAPNQGLLIIPCNNVHTAFMRFAIDVVFCDRNGRIVRIEHALRPFRVAVAFQAYCCLELAAGEAKRLGLHPKQSMRQISELLSQ